jgi:hypothetical protein
MAKVHSKAIPYLKPRPFEDGSGWYVEAQWIGRPAEQLGRFAVYSDAHDWITLQSISYFVLRELGQPVKTCEQSSNGLENDDDEARPAEGHKRTEEESSE